MNKYELVLYTTAILLIAFQYSYAKDYKEQAYCESLYMTNQVELMREEGCDVEQTAERIYATKTGK